MTRRSRAVMRTATRVVLALAATLFTLACLLVVASAFV
jgi:hypothetical protein